MQEDVESLAIVTPTSLKIGTIDEIQKLHVKTIPLGETPRRIAYDRTSHCMAVLSTKIDYEADEEKAYIKLVDEQAYSGEFTISV
jgi:DNA damage-binding protein 1